MTGSNVCTPDAVLINVRRTSCPTANAFPRFVNTASIPDRTDTGTFAADVVVVVVVRRMVEDDIWILDFSLALRATQCDRRGCGYSITIRSVLSVDVWMLCLSLCDERERSQSCAFEVETVFGSNFQLCVLSPMRRGERGGDILHLE